MSVLDTYSESRLSLPPLDTSAASPVDSLDTPFPLTPSDPFLPSWAPPRIADPAPLVRIAKYKGNDHDEDEWPVDVPLHMVNVFRVFAVSSTNFLAYTYAQDLFRRGSMTALPWPRASSAKRPATVRIVMSNPPKRDALTPSTPYRSRPSARFPCSSTHSSSRAYRTHVPVAVEYPVGWIPLAVSSTRTLWRW